MTQEKELADLLQEFERVGVDPNTISAGLAVSRNDVMRALRSLPDQAGPEAFLSRLRVIATHGAVADGGANGLEDHR